MCKWFASSYSLVRSLWHRSSCRVFIRKYLHGLRNPTKYKGNSHTMWFPIHIILQNVHDIFQRKNLSVINLWTIRSFDRRLNWTIWYFKRRQRRTMGRNPTVYFVSVPHLHRPMHWMRKMHSSKIFYLTCVRTLNEHWSERQCAAEKRQHTTVIVSSIFYILQLSFGFSFSFVSMRVSFSPNHSSLSHSPYHPIVFGASQPNVLKYLLTAAVYIDGRRLRLNDD